MTTIKKLRTKAIDLEFDKYMEVLGFTLGPDEFWFYRWRGSILDVIDFWVGSSGKFVKVPILCCNEKIFSIYKDWQPDFSVFPSNFTHGLALFSDRYINQEYGVEIGADPWSIQSDQDIIRMFSELEIQIKENADPWFKQFIDNATLYESFSIRCQKSEFGQKVKKLLAEGEEQDV